MSLVMGGITGVGIWFIIALVNPAATSLLIHTFVFGWAAEWVFFIVEITAIFVYFYCFDTMDVRTHQLVGWIYFIAAWLSLFLINGIVGFMLTPGDWLVNHNFWSGFFNPSFWPSLFFRTFISLMLAGVYAFISTSCLKDSELKFTMTKYSSKWVLLSLIAAVPAGYWYLSVLPNQVRALVEGVSPTIHTAVQTGLYAVIGLLAGTLILLLVKPALHTKSVSFIVLVSAFLFLGAFEWTREASRRPYVINEYMYSNSILKKDVTALNSEGFLQEARWVSLRSVKENDLPAAGHEIFKHQCYACHTTRGINNQIASRTASMDFATLVNYIGKIHEIRYFMPPFAGNESEKNALAYYIIKGIHGKEVIYPEQQQPAVSGKGEELFKTFCIPCHSQDLVKEKTAAWDNNKIRWALDNLNRLQSAMPDYQGTPEEKDLVAAYIAALKNGKGDETHDEGEEAFQDNCAMCHSLRGGANPLLPMLNGWSPEKIRSSLDRLDKLRGGMPPLLAPGEAKDALAGFLAKSLQGGER
jgi:mono/diheme cytochrome c family protein